MKNEKVRYIVKVQIGNQIYFSTTKDTDGVSYNSHIKRLSNAIQEGEPVRLDTSKGTHLFGREALAKAIISFIIVE